MLTRKNNYVSTQYLMDKVTHQEKNLKNGIAIELLVVKLRKLYIECLLGFFIVIMLLLAGTNVVGRNIMKQLK